MIGKVFLAVMLGYLGIAVSAQAYQGDTEDEKGFNSSLTRMPTTMGVHEGWLPSGDVMRQPNVTPQKIIVCEILSLAHQAVLSENWREACHEFTTAHDYLNTYLSGDTSQIELAGLISPCKGYGGYVCTQDPEINAGLIAAAISHCFMQLDDKREEASWAAIGGWSLANFSQTYCQSLELYFTSLVRSFDPPCNKFQVLSSLQGILPLVEFVLRLKPTMVVRDQFIRTYFTKANVADFCKEHALLWKDVDGDFSRALGTYIYKLNLVII